MSFFVACFIRIALARLREVATKCKFLGRRGILSHMMKFGGSLARNIDFEVVNFKLLVKTRRKTLILVLQLVKIEGSPTRNARFGASTCVIACLWLRRVYGGSCKTFRLRRCQSVKKGGSL